MLLASNRTPPLTALLLSAALCFLVSARLRAQEETTSAITGQVTDASCAAISGATVTIVSIFGVAAAASKSFPVSYSQPFN